MLETATKPAPVVAKKQLKRLLLPTEHGVWGFWLEPSLLGLLLFPSWAGLSLVLAVLAAILAQQPLVIAVRDYKRRNVYMRTRLALRLAVGLACAALLLVGLSGALSGSGRFLVPLACALPLAFYQFWARFNKRERSLAAELLGAGALAALAPSIALLAGQFWGLAGLLASVILARTLPSIWYVRARLRLERGRQITRVPSLLSAGLALILITTLSVLTSLPTWTVLAFVVLLVRASIGLSPYRRKLQTKTIGLLEMAYGLLVVLSVWLGAL